MEKICVIMDISTLDWDPSRVHIPERVRPTALFYDRDLAEEVLLKLAAKYPDRDYILFESRAYAHAINSHSGAQFVLRDYAAGNLEVLQFLQKLISEGGQIREAIKRLNPRPLWERARVRGPINDF